jgi:hypothetical protein
VREELRTSKSYSRLPCVEGRASCGCGFSVQCRSVVVHLCKQGIQAPPLPCGPGCHLKRLLARFGIAATDACPCNRHAAQMDLWGPDQCDRNKSEIVGWLRDEAKRRGLPFIEAAGVLMVNRAIRLSRLELNGDLTNESRPLG